MSLRSRISIVCLIAGAMMRFTAEAQEVEATVSLNVNQLPVSLQQEVAGFADELQRYVGATKWTNLEWPSDKLQMSFTVAFTNIQSDGSYGVKLVVGSQRKLDKSGALSPMMKVLDEKWSFTYARNQPLYQDPSGYDEITGLIDFYVYVALGLELDSRSYLGGATMYDRARTIALRAQTSRGVSGWDMSAPSGQYSRYSLVRELTDLRYNPIRKFIYDYHHTALDNIAADRAAALDSANAYLSDLVRIVDKLVEPTTIVRVITDTKYQEFAEMFIRYPDPLVWKKLLYIDPRHQSFYEVARDK